MVSTHSSGGDSIGKFIHIMSPSDEVSTKVDGCHMKCVSIASLCSGP